MDMKKELKKELTKKNKNKINWGFIIKIIHQIKSLIVIKKVKKNK